MHYCLGNFADSLEMLASLSVSYLSYMLLGLIFAWNNCVLWKNGILFIYLFLCVCVCVCFLMCFVGNVEGWGYHLKNQESAQSIGSFTFVFIIWKAHFILLWLTQGTTSSFIFVLWHVALIVEKMVKSHLRWFGHVWRRPIEAIVRRVD